MCFYWCCKVWLKMWACHTSWVFLSHQFGMYLHTKCTAVRGTSACPPLRMRKEFPTKRYNSIRIYLKCIVEDPSAQYWIVGFDVRYHYILPHFLRSKCYTIALHKHLTHHFHSWYEPHLHPPRPIPFPLSRPWSDCPYQTHPQVRPSLTFSSQWIRKTGLY